MLEYNLQLTSVVITFKNNLSNNGALHCSAALMAVEMVH